MPVTPNQELQSYMRSQLVAVGGPFEDCADIEVTPTKDSFDATDKNYAGGAASDFAVSTPLTGGTGPGQLFVDPVDGKRKIRIIEPAGGWTWSVTAGTNLPQHVYGVWIRNTSLDIFLGQINTPDMVLDGSGLSFGIGELVIDLDDLDLGA